MLWIFYDFAMFIMTLVARAGGMFSGKLKLRNRGLRDQKIPSLQNCIWIHAASLGEFEQGKSIIDGLRAQYPEKKLVLTFFSASGYEKRYDYANVDHVFYLPYDRYRGMKNFVSALNPELVVIVKYEFWFNWMRILRRKGIPYIFVSAVFRPDQFFLKKGFGPFREVLKSSEYLFVQNQSSVDVLSEFGFDNVVLKGDTRVDRTIEIVSEDYTSPEIEKWMGTDYCVIAGSSWPPEEKWISSIYKNFPEWKWIIAPHEVNENHIRDIKSLFGDDVVTFSDLLSGECPTDDQNVPILLIDQIGLLSRLYRYGDVAVIGGGMGAGIHNTLEPAAYGIPVVFGKKYENFQEAIDFVEMDVARSVESGTQLAAALQYFSGEEKRDQVKNLLHKYFENHSGATESILQQIKKILS